jgi:outer membrane protein
MLSAPNSDPCALDTPTTPLPLFEAVEHALCHNPQTRAAWANVKAQAAQVGSARAAYLPTLTGSVQGVRDHSVMHIPSNGALNSEQWNHYQTDTLNLSWMLYDFGARSAALDNAKQLLAAAQANHDAALQKVFAATAKDYYAAVATQANAGATRAIEDDAKQSLRAASARVSGGVAAISDQLQAQTAYAQAQLNRVKADGELRSVLGTLALDMGLPVGQIQHVADGQEGPTVLRHEEWSKPVEALLAEAERENPQLAAARAQLDSARAKAQQVRAQGRPTLTLTSRASRSTQPESLGVGQPSVSAHTQERYLGVELSVPLFEGFGRTYQIRNAEAEVDVQQANLADTEQQVMLGVWSGYQTWQTSQENLRISAELLASAQAAFDAGKKRYAMGVGSILELLNVQTALANARQQRIQALADWHTARLQLAASVGRLSMDEIR